MSTRTPPTTDTPGADLMNTNLLEELTANPHMLAAVLTPPCAALPLQAPMPHKARHWRAWTPLFIDGGRP